MYKFNIKKELPLSQSEVLIKEFYLHKQKSGSSQTLTEYILSHYKEESLNKNADWTKQYHHHKINDEYTEELYIPDGYDVSIAKHLRYAPSSMHSHTFFEIVCVMNGSCINQVASHRLEMMTGDICIIAPKTEHSIEAFNDDCILLNILVRVSTFDKAFFGTLIKKDILSSFFSKTLYGSSAPETYILFQTKRDKEIESYIALAYWEYKQNRMYNERMLNSIIMMFFITLLRNHGEDAIIPNPEGNATDLKITAILNYIQTNYKTVSIAELSSVFNYSERHITRLLKDYTGDSFLVIVQRIKFNRATELLSNPDISIQEITDITGYTDISHFYRMFRKHYHMTPNQYRNMKLY
jgi:AraC-like DNA-binding protein